MAMLTAEFPPTSGDATLAGFSVTKEPEKTRRRVGYCPQFDALLMNLTGREHVELYASIKGVPPALVKEATSVKLAEVGLSEEDSDRLAAGYSGGMKRRLSLATATIGNPSIVFLDGKRRVIHDINPLCRLPIRFHFLFVTLTPLPVRSFPKNAPLE
jgi:ATP-binding cassette, subfamily A (ABC1), member 3